MGGIGGIVVGLSIGAALVEMAQCAQEQRLPKDAVAKCGVLRIVGLDRWGILDDVVHIGLRHVDLAPDIAHGSRLLRGVRGVVVLVNHIRGAGGHADHVAGHVAVFGELIVKVGIHLIVSAHQSGLQSTGIAQERGNSGTPFLVNGKEIAAGAQQHCSQGKKG